MATATCTLLLMVAGPVAGLDNGLGRTPVMGYNTWNDFRCDGITAENIRKVADVMVAYGLDKVGYDHVNIDDCWAVARGADGIIVPDPKAFPDGMKAVGDYLHVKGLKFGIYTDRGTNTCVGRPGSQGFEAIDAQTYASWGVDYLKEDSCNAPTDHATAVAQYGKMRDALNATGRPIYFALCGWSAWYAPVGKQLANSWRVGYDVNQWENVWGNALSVTRRLGQYAGPGGFNDIDALIGSTQGAAVCLTETQSRTQFSLWSMLAAPLIIGSNMLHLSAHDLETYTNTEVIAVNQDPLGLQAEVFWENCPSGTELPLAWKPRFAWKLPRLPASWGLPDFLSQPRGLHRFGPRQVGKVPDCQQIWLKRLADGFAVAFVNFTTTPVQLGPGRHNAFLTFDVAQALGWQMAHVRDLWAHEDLGVHSTVRVALEGNGASRLFKLTQSTVLL